MPSATGVVQARTRRAVGEPDPAILAGAHQAEAGARLVAELVPAQRVARRQHRDQHAVAGVRRHLRADRRRMRTSGPSGTIARTSLPF